MEFHQSSLKQCAFPKERVKKDTTIYWIVGDDAAQVTLVEKRARCELTPNTFSCACSIEVMPVESVGSYLKKALADGKFRELVLVGTQTAMQRVRHHLPETLMPLITTEIIEPDKEFSAHL